MTQQQLAASQADPAPFFAEISAAYIEVLAGVRRAEQLARWLSDKMYYDLCQRAQRQSRQRQITGLRSRPEITLRATKTFVTDLGAYQGVVLFRVNGTIRAVSIRAELINTRHRITDIVLI
jgi:hypothetical protein